MSLKIPKGESETYIEEEQTTQWPKEKVQMVKKLQLMTALFIHVAYRIGSCRQQIHLMLFKADGLVEKQTVEGFIMQIFSHIDVQLLLNDNKVCYVANHTYIGSWASNKIKCCFPMNYHAWVHRELGKIFVDCCVQ